MSKAFDFLWRYANSYDFMERIGRATMPPLIITCACNGGVQGKEYNDAIPETADEIADSVYEAYKAGAAVVHAHARNPKNITGPATTAEDWFEVNKKIRERCPDIIINNTTGGSFESTMEDRLSCLDANPEMASLNLTPDMSKFKLKERNAPLRDPRPAVDVDECCPFTYNLVNKYAEQMLKRNIKPEMETYHTGGAWVMNDLIANGMLKKPYYVQTVMGVQTASYPTPENVINLLKEFPEDTLWLSSGIGPFQLPLTTFAILMGGHVRIGLEDNIYYRKGEKAKSNAQFVERTVRLSHELNRDVATPAQARKMLDISEVPSTYHQLMKLSNH